MVVGGGMLRLVALGGFDWSIASGVAEKAVPSHRLADQAFGLGRIQEPAAA